MSESVNNKVLVVDDEPSIRDLFGEILNQAGYAVFTAGGAQETLEVLQQEAIQVMFLDLNMPGTNGLELCRRIRHKNPIAVIIAVTGYSSLFELAECRDAGFDDYFIKPVRAEALIQAAALAFEKINRWTRR